MAEKMKKIRIGEPGSYSIQDSRLFFNISDISLGPCAPVTCSDVLLLDLPFYITKGTRRYGVRRAHSFHDFPNCFFIISSSIPILHTINTYHPAACNITNQTKIALTTGHCSAMQSCITVLSDINIAIVPARWMKRPVYPGCHTIAYGPVVTNSWSGSTESSQVNRFARVRCAHTLIRDPIQTRAGRIVH